MIAKPLQNWIANAPAYGVTFSERLQQFLGSFQPLLKLGERLQSAAAPATDTPAREVVVQDSQLYAYLSQVTGYSLGILTTIVLSLATAAFLMASGDLFYAKLVRVLPTLRDKKTALRIV
jgi:predicted PurR-regulated permease PerM